MIAELLLIVSLAFAATMLGGVFALRFRDNLHLILGFSAGAVVAVALFDLLPRSRG
jgi:ZIP family zinc transporter